MTYHSDYDVYGFRKSDILPILAKRGIVLDLECPPVDARDAEVVDDVPEWRSVMARRKRLTDFEASCLLAGMNPETDTYNLGYGNGAEADFNMHEAILNEALDDGSLAFELCTVSGYSEKKRMIAAEDFAAWCDHNNVPRPLPWNFEWPPATDAELQQALQENRQQLAEAMKQTAHLQAEISRLQSELAQAKASQPKQQQAQDGSLKFRHETRLLHLVAAAQERYAGENLDISDRDTWPKKANVIEWLREQEPGLSGKVADVIDTIAMPFNRGK